MFRSLPTLHLGARTAPQAGARPRVGLNLPLAAPSGIQAAQTGAMGGHPAPVEFECRVGGCREPRSDHHTGYCSAHTDRYLTHVHEHTAQIGRGDLP